MDEPVAPGNFKQAVAQMGLNHRALAVSRRLLESLEATESGIKIDGLLTVGLEPANQRGQVLGTFVPVEFRHLPDGRGKDRIEPGVKTKKIFPAVCEGLQIRDVAKIQTTGVTG